MVEGPHHAGLSAEGQDRAQVIARRVVHVATAAVSAIGAIALIGWVANLPMARSLGPGLPAMMPATAVSFLIAAAALWSIAAAHGRPTTVGQVGAGVVMLVGFVRLIDYQLHLGLSIDHLALDSALGSSQGSMSPFTAINFVIFGAAELLAARRVMLDTSNLLALLGAIVAWLQLSHYVFGGEPSAVFSPMAFPSSLGFLGLSVGLIAALPERGVMGFLRQPGEAGVMARRLLPVAILAPLALGWLRLQGERLGIFAPETGIAWFALANSLVFGGFVVISASVLKRTERARAKDAADRDLLAAIVESSADAIIAKSLDGVVKSWNKGAEELFGYSEEEMVGAAVRQIIPPELLGQEDLFLARIRQGEEIEHFETVRRRKDGRNIQVSLSLAPIRDEAGQIVGISNVARDITDRKLAEVELHRQADELARSNQDLEQFAFVASHDLQTPLRGIGGCLELLQKRYQGRLDPQADELIAHSLTNLGRLQELIHGLLSYSRVGRADVEMEMVDCGRIVSDLRETLLVGLEQEATITVGKLPKLLGSRVQIWQLFQNLLSNSLRFRGSDPPRITVSATEIKGEKNGAPAGWQFSVQDNGIGISPEHRDRMFTMFRRLHNDPEVPGTGVGLALCKRIVELHGGRIWVDSVPGRGSTFYFTILKRGGTDGQWDGGTEGQRDRS